MAPEFEMKKTRPDKGEASAGEVSDETHEDGEVRDHHCEYYGHHNNDDAEGEAPHLELPVQCPDAREPRLRLALGLHTDFFEGHFKTWLHIFAFF